MTSIIKRRIVSTSLAAAMVLSMFSFIPAKAQKTSENLALNKSATTTSHYIDDTYGPEVFKAVNAVDGDESTLWATECNLSDYPNVFTIDLGERHVIDTVILRAPTSHVDRTKTVSVKVSDDGINYRPWIGTTNSNNNANLTLYGSAVSAQYVTFSFTGSTSGLAYSEIEVYRMGSDSNVEHTITYAGGIGSSVGTTPPVQTAKENEQITLLDCTYIKEGYSFVAWSDGTRLYRTGDLYTVPNHDVEFTAIWRLNSELENLALGGLGTSTDEWDENYVAQNAFDNNRDTLWATKRSDTGVFDKVLTLDLGKELEFNVVQMQIPSSHIDRMSAYSIEVAKEDGVYTQVCSQKAEYKGVERFVSEELLNARYLRFSFEGSYNGLAISEIEVFNDGGARPPQENLMTGAIAESEHEYIEDDGSYKGMFTAQKAVDGDDSTSWATRVLESDIYITLPETKTFNQVVLKETPAYKLRVKSYEVYVSDDNENWTLWETRYRGNGVTSIVADEVSTKYMKIHVSGSGSYQGFNIDEILLHNDPKAIPSEELKPAEPRPIDPNWIKPDPSEEPSVYQLRKADMKYGMFLCYSINTYFGEEWSTGRPLDQLTPETYAVPTSLDVEQWVKSAWEGGMNYVLLVTKHHEGFCIWDSEYTDFDLGSSGGEKIDVIDEVAKACEKYGLKLALYYSLWDTHWTMSHSHLSEAEKVRQYNDYMNNQVTELLDGRYGEVCELWLDGGWANQPKLWELEMLYNTVKTLQPGCQMSTNWTVTDDRGDPKALGGGTYPEYQQEGDPILYFPADFRLGDPRWTKPGDQDPKIFTYENENYYLPFEATICMNNSWFAQDYNTPEAMKDAEYAKTAYEHFVNQGNTFVYNLAPRKDGRLADYEVERLYESARLLNIERGDAKLDKSGDCVVEIRHVTDEGYVANVTEQLWGNDGETYFTQPADNMEAMGYELIETPKNATGKFVEGEKIVVEYVYHDVEKNGKLEEKYTVTVDGEEVYTGVYNDKVTVTAPVVEGQTFTAWLFDGKVISTDATYTFFLSKDMELTPCYEAVEMNAEALLTNAMLVKRADSKADVKFVAQLIVPEGYTVKDAGLVWSSKEGVELSLDNENLKPTYITKISTTNQFSVTIKGMPKGKFIRGKIFATLVDSEGNETVVYSDETRVVNK